MTNTNPTAADLAAAMEFDHVVLIREDGTLDGDPERDLYAPTVECYKAWGQDEWIDELSQLGEWTLLTGHTGQHGYSGHVMHASEVIGGGLADYMLERPGHYVAVTVEAPCGYDGTTPCSEETGCDCEPAGWAVAFRPFDN